MLFGKYSKKIDLNDFIYVIILFLCVVLTIAWWHFISKDKCHIDSMFILGGGFNPPSISFGIYAILMMFTVFFLDKTLGFSTRLSGIFEIVSKLGKHTLYIFLYHRLFLDWILWHLQIATGLFITNIWVMRVVYYSSMFWGPIIIEVLLKSLYKSIKKICNK